MKMDVINDGSCDQRLTCFYEECCNHENLNHEFFMIHLVIYSILIIYSLVCSYKMREYCKPNLKDKEYFSDKTSDFHLFNIFSSPLIKYSIFYLIISKCFIIYFSKYFLNFGDLRYYSTPSYDQSSFIEDRYNSCKFSFMIEVTQGWVLQLSLLIISYNLIQLSGDFLEFYKKNVILISIYLIILSANVKTYFNREILIYQTYGFLSIICLLISILTIFLTIIGNRVFFSRLSINI